MIVQPLKRHSSRLIVTVNLSHNINAIVTHFSYYHAITVHTLIRYLYAAHKARNAKKETIYG